MLKAPMSIRQQGLEFYLDSTAQDHQGYTYKDFERMVSARVDTANLARIFEVSRNTMFKWRTIYKEEQQSKLV
jgi:transposase-like protein